MGLAERRSWLFPGGRGWFQGIDLDQLDPADEGDRRALIQVEHPEIDRAIRDGLDEVGDTAAMQSGRLHLLIHEVVANQVWDDDPPEVGFTLDRLRAAGYERHEVLHMLGAAMAKQMWHAGMGPPADLEDYAAALHDLPGSWMDDEDLDEDELDDDLLEDALEILAEMGPLGIDDLAAELDADTDDVRALAAHDAIVILADSRLALVGDLLAGTVLTHRLGGDEVGQEAVELGVDLGPVQALLCQGDHLHLAGDQVVPVVERDEEDRDSPLVLCGDHGWLGAAGPGDLVGFRFPEEPGDGSAIVEMTILTECPPAPEMLSARLKASFGLFGGGDGMPVTPVELLCQVAVDAPALVQGTLPPLGDILTSAGFEVRRHFTAPAGTDWALFDRLHSDTEVAARYGLGVDGARALLLLLELARAWDAGGAGRLDGATAMDAADAFGDPDFAEAFAEASGRDPAPAAAFLARLRELAGRRQGPALAWAESLAARRAGDVRRAESCLQAALAVDPYHEQALEDAAWYASDRGDAARAVRYLDRMDDDLDEQRTELLRTYARPGSGPARVGRNDPCPCGSGRKFKHCCLLSGEVAAQPLPERVRWIWEKLRWWLDRSGREDDAMEAALEMLGGYAGPDGETAFDVDFDIAASLVLFADRAIEEFLAERGSLLPPDEANLVSQWALTERSVYEAVSVQPGHGLTLRDQRSGDIVDVRERRGSRALAAGDLLYAHPVFDGEGYQFVGGVVPVPLALRDPLMRLLDESPKSRKIAALIGQSRRPPELFNMEGEPMVLCEARYRVADPAAAAEALDSVLEADEAGRWADWVEVKDDRWMRGQVRIEGRELELSANSEARFDRLTRTVTEAVAGLELLDQERRTLAEIGRSRRGRHLAPDDTGRETDPALAEALTDFVREREKKWIDEPVPALAGLTPRQAAADPTRREDLIALLHDFDRHQAPPGGVTFDTGRLRDLLGLTGLH